MERENSKENSAESNKNPVLPTGILGGGELEEANQTSSVQSSLNFPLFTLWTSSTPFEGWRNNVTLGGTGKVGGDRHPKIGGGVLIGAGATVLGNVKIGEGAKIGAGSVVLIDVPARTTAVGNPARFVGGKEKPKMHEDVPGESMDHTSFISRSVV